MNINVTRYEINLKKINLEDEEICQILGIIEK